MRKVPSGRGSRTAQFPVKSAAKDGTASSHSKTAGRGFISTKGYNNRTSAQIVLWTASIHIFSRICSGELELCPIWISVYSHTSLESAQIYSTSVEHRQRATITEAPQCRCGRRACASPYLLNSRKCDFLTPNLPFTPRRRGFSDTDRRRHRRCDK